MSEGGWHGEDTYPFRDFRSIQSVLCSCVKEYINTVFRWWGLRRDCSGLRRCRLRRIGRLYKYQVRESTTQLAANTTATCQALQFGSQGGAQKLLEVVCVPTDDFCSMGLAVSASSLPAIWSVVCEALSVNTFSLSSRAICTKRFHHTRKVS